MFIGVFGGDFSEPSGCLGVFPFWPGVFLALPVPNVWHCCGVAPVGMGFLDLGPARVLVFWGVNPSGGFPLGTRALPPRLRTFPKSWGGFALGPRRGLGPGEGGGSNLNLWSLARRGGFMYSTC